MFEVNTKNERLIEKIILIINTCKNKSFSTITADWLEKKSRMQEGDWQLQRATPATREDG